MVSVNKGFIDSVLESYGSDREMIIPIMQEIQNEYKFLPGAALEYTAKKLGMSDAELYGIVSFYGNFTLSEKGKYVIKICNGTACHVRKSDEIQDALYDATGMSPEDHISKDGLFSIQRVSCLGACSLAPVCVVNDVVHAKMTPDKIHRLIIDLREDEGQ